MQAESSLPSLTKREAEESGLFGISCHRVTSTVRFVLFGVYVRKRHLHHLTSRYWL